MSADANAERPADDPDVEAALREYLERFEHEGHRALRTVARRAPRIAHQLRRRVRMLWGMAVLLQPGTRRFAGYQLLARVHGGGMGAVYKARRWRGAAAEAPLVALKLLPAAELGSADAAGSRAWRLEREARVVAGLDHPGIVKILEAGTHDGTPYLVMEWVEGESLHDRLRRLAGTPPAQRNGAALGRPAWPGWPEACADLAAWVADALHHAHGHAVIHRDVKPGNILLGVDGQVLLCDFGHALPEREPQLTMTRGVLGSTPYMAPEQVRGERERIGPWTDVYGLGVTLFQLLTGELPYFAPDEPLQSTERRILAGRCPAIRARNPAVSHDLEAVCRKAMDPDPRWRYASAQLLAEDLRRVLAGTTIVGRRPGFPTRARRLARRHAVLLLCLAAVALLVALVRSWLAEQDQRDQLADAGQLALLVAEERNLWPVEPALGPGLRAMEAWLARAEALLAHRDRHTAALAGLRARGTPGDPTAWEHGGEWRELLDRKQFLQAERPRIERFIDLAKAPTLARLDRQLAEVNAELDDKFAWRFGDPRDESQHVALVQLCTGLRHLARLWAEVQFRRGAAMRSQRALVDPRWSVIAAAVARDPRFGGLVLAPQAGLLPLGADPDRGMFEFAWLPSGEAPGRDPATGRLQMTEASAIVLVLLPGGRCLTGAVRPSPGHPVGAPHVDLHADPNEGPLVEAQLLPFFLSKYEMTQGQWLRVMGDNPSLMPPGARGDAGPPVTLLFPVDSVSWREAQEAMRRLGLCLPTDAQWEHGARGGTATLWWTGNDLASLQGAANLPDASYRRAEARPGYGVDWDDGYPYHAPVDTLRANPFGLHHVHGNVSEWCLDGGGYGDPRTDRSSGNWRMWVRENGGHSQRGSNHEADPLRARSAARGSSGEGNREEGVGVRPCRKVER